MKEKFKITEVDVGSRLDLYLAMQMDHLTRSFIKKQITDNRVTVNKKVEYKANYKVKAGDSIILEYEEIPTNVDDLEAEDIPIDILYEDDDLVAINKETGMVVHPATGNWKGTLINALVYRYKDLKGIGNRIRSGLINRIDKDTSGIVLVGKTNKALWFYSRQFANREVHKEYIAVVQGDFLRALKEEDEVTVRNYLDRNPKVRTKFAVVGTGKGRLAISHFSVIDVSADGRYSFVKIRIETGRTHQIRVHANYLGYPVVGDKIYGGDESTRLMLHAYKIRLTSIANEPLKIVAAVDGKFEKFLRNNFDSSQIDRYITKKKSQSKKK